MKIIEALKVQDSTLRITTGNRYMYWNTISSEWVVVEQSFRMRKDVIQIMTPDEDLAVKYLRGEF